MRLTHAAILILNGLEVEDRNELAKLLDVHPKTLVRYILENDDNLTKAVSLEFIKIKSGLAIEQILDHNDSELKGEAISERQI